MDIDGLGEVLVDPSPRYRFGAQRRDLYRLKLEQLTDLERMERSPPRNSSWANIQFRAASRCSRS